MDIFLLRTFQGQVLLQCEFLLTATADLNQALGANDLRRCFYDIQNLLNAAANIAKAFWGQSGKGLEGPRKPLRDSVGVTDDSPLKIVAMRNNFEHLDDRLDKWWKQSIGHNYIDLNIGPPSAFGLATEPIDWFRNFDPTTAELHFWGQSFNLQTLVTEVEKILPKLREEAAKPHWETGPQAPPA